jgi:hypothetical protein
LTPTSIFEWLSWSLGVDGAALLAYIAAFYRYGDRTEVYRNSLSGTRDLIVEIERQIAFELAVRLKPVFSGDIPPVIEVVLFQADGSLSREVTVNPVGSEKYREAVLDFVLSQNDAMIAYRIVTLCRNRWVRWARCLSWSLLAGIVMHGIFAFALIGVRLADLGTMPKWWLQAGCASSLCLFIFVLFCVASMMRSHDQIQHYRRVYGSD